jgi:3',5'-cyclic AMP phosphodiesterase CpdA
MVAFTLAHLSDPHLGPLPAARLRELAGKRILGFTNWRRNRHAHHRGEVLDALIQDLARQNPDHTAVTGDLVNIGLDAEFAPARIFLERLGAPTDVTVVPGNHDVYVRSTAAHHGRHWGDYMSGDTAPAPVSPDRPGRFPFVRRRGPIALIGTSSAVPTAPFMATGRLGTEQLHRLGEILARLGEEGAFRVILIHHPPVGHAGDRFKRLMDGRQFRRLLARHGAELVLHGHEHIHSLHWLSGPDKRIPVVGVPSASQMPHGDRDPGAYNLYRIFKNGDHWACDMITRGFRSHAQGVAEVQQRPLSVIS